MLLSVFVLANCNQMCHAVSVLLFGVVRCCCVLQFSANHPIHVLLCLFLNFKNDTPNTIGEGLNPHSVSFPDAARCIRKMLEVDLARLPSQCETFFCTTDLPHGRYSNRKTKAVLGWEPQDKLVKFYLKPASKL